MNSLVTHLSYLGPISYYASYKKHDLIYIEANENYQKRSPRNRCHLNTIKEPLILSIPLNKGKNNSMPITEVSIAYNDDWTKIHLKQIENCYHKAAFYPYYYPELKALYQPKEKLLFDFNFKLMLWAFEKLNWDKKILLTEEFKHSNYQLDYLPREYPQVYDYKKGFTKNLSILDLLMNVGPEANYYL